MATSAVLTNPHRTDRWTAASLGDLDLGGGQELAEFVAAAPVWPGP